MKYRLATLLIVLSLSIPQITWGADTKGKESAVDRVSALPFDKAAPLPGALAVSADGRVVAHISANGDVVIWDSSQMKPLEVIPAGEKKPSAVSLSPDGNIIAIGYFDSRLVVRVRQGRKPLREFFGHSGGISALTFSLDGQLLASGGDDATTQLWEVATGKRLHVFDSMSNDDISTGSGIPVSIGFSGDGQALIVNEWYSRFYDVGRGTTIWDIKEGIEISTRAVAPPNSDNAMRVGHALGGKGWLLAYTGGWLSGKTGLMVERVDQCDAPRQLPSGGFADTVAADPLGRWVAAAEGEKITFFGMNGDKKSHAFALPAKAIALVPHPDGRSVLALVIVDTRLNGNEHFIFGRDAETVTGGALYRITVPTSFWRSPPVSVKEDATRCAPTVATRMQQDFKLPETPSELPVMAKLMPTKEMTADRDNPTGGRVQSGYPNELYFREGSLFVFYQGSYTAEAYARTGVVEWDLQTRLPRRAGFVSYADRDLIMRLREGWGEAREKLTDLLTGKPFSDISNSNDKRTYLRATVLSDPDTGQVLRRTAKHFERYAANGRRLPDIATKGNVVDCTARNGRLAALYGDGDVQVWQLKPGGGSKTYKLGLKLGDGEWAEDLALSADGRYLRVAFPNASGDGPTRYVIYRLSSAEPVGNGQLLSPFPGRSNRGVVADTRPHRLAVWDFDKGEIIARLPRHRSRDQSGVTQPLRATLSDDGRLLASASHDGVIRVWAIDAHQVIGEARTGGEVTAMVFDPTGQRLAAGRKDGQVVVFQVGAPE